jgi:hypothetical protein
MTWKDKYKKKPGGGGRKRGKQWKWPSLLGKRKKLFGIF